MKKMESFYIDWISLVHDEGSELVTDDRNDILVKHLWLVNNYQKILSKAIKIPDSTSQIGKNSRWV